jgi:hypothetical protein
MTPEDIPNPGRTCSFPDIAPFPKKKKTGNPTVKKRGKMHSEVLTSTPKKIMLEEVREKRFIAQKTKEARERGKLRNQKGKEPPKRNNRKTIHLSRRERRLVAEKSFLKVLQKMRSSQ